MKSNHQSQTEFLSILFLGVALSATGLVRAQFVVEDTEFADSSWTATVLDSTGSPTQTAERTLQGGFPDAYRYMTHDMEPDNSFILVFHEYLGASYVPAAQGAIDALCYSESHIQFSPPFPGAEIGASPAIRQGSTVFSGPGITYGNENWVDVELNALRADDFSADAAHPDFSANGAPMHFGYIRQNTTEFGADREFGIDNWRFSTPIIVEPDCDSIPSDVDNCPFVTNSNQLNTDSDAFGNACDNCDFDDNPDQTNTDLGFVGGDEDGDVCDDDDDADTILDPDDNCPLIPNTDQINTDLELPDGDEDGDVCDDDDDADAILDTEDNCPIIPNPDQADFDEDLIGDVCDNCAFINNPNQTNTDLNLPGGDEDGDACDDDDDADAILDTEDNCSLHPNFDQFDADADGIGNRCDPDGTQDCFVNFPDLSAMRAAFFTSDPIWDLDGNGLVNFVDLSIMKDFFLRQPGPSGVPNVCD